MNYYDSLLVDYPNSPYLISMRTCNLVYHNKVDIASNYISQEINKNNKLRDNSFILMALGVLNEKNKTKDYHNYFLRSLKANFSERNKWVHLNLYEYYKESDEKKAIHYLDSALKIDSEFTRALIIKSYLLDQINNCKEIIKNLEIVFRNYQDYEVASYLANAYYNCYNIEKAEYFFNESNDIYPNCDAYLGLGRIEEFENKNYLKALNFYKKGLELSPNNVLIIQEIAWLYYEIEDYLKSEKYLLKSIKIDNSQEIYNDIIHFYLLLKEVEKAKKYNFESKKYNKQNSYNIGFDIIIRALEQEDGWENRFLKEISSYGEKYNDFESNWLQEVISSLIIIE